MYGAVDESLSGQEGSPEQGRVARVAPKAALRGVPVLSLVRHLSLVDADGVPARVAVFREGGVEAVQAEGSAVPHHVPLPAQLTVALEAAEVAHVPRSSLGLRALVGKNDLEKKKKNTCQVLS